MIVSESIEFIEKISSVVNHPSWQGAIDEQTVVILLKDQPITGQAHQKLAASNTL